MDIEKLGMAKATDLINFALVACARVLAFQPAESLLRTSALISSKVFFLFL